MAEHVKIYDVSIYESRPLVWLGQLCELVWTMLTLAFESVHRKDNLCSVQSVRAVRVIGKRETFREPICGLRDKCPIGKKLDRFRWRLSEILHCNNNAVWCCHHRERIVGKSDIRPKLPSFRVLCSRQLDMRISDLRPESVTLVEGHYKKSGRQYGIEDDSGRNSHLGTKFPIFTSGIFFISLVVLFCVTVHIPPPFKRRGLRGLWAG